MLAKLARGSRLSGGSIFAGVLATAWDRLIASPDVAHYQQLVVDPLRKFCKQQIDTVAVGEGLLTPWKSVRDGMTAKYQSDLVPIGRNQLPDAPTFVFNAPTL